VQHLAEELGEQEVGGEGGEEEQGEEEQEEPVLSAGGDGRRGWAGAGTSSLGGGYRGRRRGMDGRRKGGM
jgi:hypothetical protein